MATNIVFNGVVYSIPAVGEEDWGTSLTNYFIAIPQGALQKTGGIFTLTADANFGANFGLLAAYFASRSANRSTAGLIRLAVSDTIGFRNNANSGNLLLAVNGSDQLTFNGVVLQVAGNYITALTGDVTASGPGAAAATISNGVITNAQVNASAAIDFSKINAASSVQNSDLAQMAAHTFKGNNTGSSANPSDLTISQVTAELSVSAATASTLMGRDSNANSKINNLVSNFATTATAAGTTTLTVASAPLQQFTGSTTQTVVLPDATTLSLGHSFTILNRSSGAVTVNKNGGSLVQAVAAGSQLNVVVTDVSTSAGTWDASVSGGTGSGTVTSVAMTVPAEFSVAGSPVTTSGTLAVSKANQSANTVFAGPSSGGATAPTFRSLVAADLPLVSRKNVFTASGTWTKPATVLSTTIVKVIVVGAGGGGGGGSTSSGCAGAGGGGAGGYSIRWIAGASLGSSESVTVGTGGSGGGAGGAGSAGNSSSFGSLLSATGGSGGSPSVNDKNAGTGGSGGAGSTGDINGGGQAGGPGSAGSAGNFSGSGGMGGSSLMGGGGMAGAATSGTPQSGSNGTNYGAGGGGGQGDGVSGLSGGNGSDGIVIVEWFG
jgi:hypothetical protein